MERASRGAQLYVLGARLWVEGTSPAASSVVVKFGNVGGSIARNLTISSATIDGATFPLTETVMSVPPGEEPETTMILQMPKPIHPPWPVIGLTVRYTDANGEQTQTLPEFRWVPEK
jgi:hypothetical protein